MIDRRRPGAVLAAFSMATLLAACLDAAVPSAAPTSTRAPEPTATVTRYELAATVWYEGLYIHVDRAVTTLDARGGPVDVSIRVENPGPESTDLTAPIRLLVGEAVIDPTRELQVPSIPAVGLASAVLTFELQGIPSAQDAVVLIGVDPQHVARLPLAVAGAGARIFQPVALELSGAGAAGDLRIRLKSGELRWDLPDWSQQLDAGLQALTLTYDVTYQGAFAGGLAFTGENVRLRLPDGALVEPRHDGHSQSIELIGAGKTKANLFSRFEIPTGTAGKLALVVVERSAERAIPFTIGE